MDTNIKILPNHDANNSSQTRDISNEQQEPIQQPQQNTKKESTTSNNMDTMRHALDKATGLVQTIRMDRLSEEVIRKMPPDEYLQILSLLDEVMNGSIDTEI